MQRNVTKAALAALETNNKKILMKKIIRLLFYCSFSLPIFMEGCFCKTTKKISAALIKKDTVQVKAITTNTNIDSLNAIKMHVAQLKSNMLSYKTLKAKAKVEYATSKEGYPVLNAYINIKHNDRIWVRIALPGTDLELYKILITKDSVTLLDNRANTAYKRSFSYLQEVSNLPFDFTAIENLLAGNPIAIPDSIIGFKYTDKALSVYSVSPNFKERIDIDTTQKIMLNAKLDDVDLLKSRTCQITYSGHETVENKLISLIREVIVADKQTSSIKLQFKDVYFDREDLNFNIRIPKKYKLK
jgi:outer membrane lipoprotein-sorting protein